MKLLGPVAQLIPFRGVPLKGRLNDTDLEVIQDGGVLIQDGKIIEIGSFNTLFKQWKKELEGSEVVPCQGVMLPGLVDAHTHICWAGSRANDYAARTNGMSYQEISAQGGGIWQTVQHVRDASPEVLEQAMLSRADAMRCNGINTFEVKSGYGLCVESELKMLRVIKAASAKLPQDVIATLFVCPYGSQRF